MECINKIESCSLLFPQNTAALSFHFLNQFTWLPYCVSVIKNVVSHTCICHFSVRGKIRLLDTFYTCTTSYLNSHFLRFYEKYIYVGNSGKGNKNKIKMKWNTKSLYKKSNLMRQKINKSESLLAYVWEKFSFYL